MPSEVADVVVRFIWVAKKPNASEAGQEIFDGSQFGMIDANYS